MIEKTFVYDYLNSTKSIDALVLSVADGFDLVSSPKTAKVEKIEFKTTDENFTWLLMSNPECANLIKEKDKSYVS